MKIKYILLGLLVCGLIAWGAKTAYISKTDGFSLTNITSEPYDGSPWAVPGPVSDEVNQALNQEYRYLGKGHQAYVFESQDSRYVLKFIKFQKYRHHPLFAMLPLPESLDKDRAKQALHKIDKRNALFTSWKIANTKLKDETLVEFIHVDLSDGFNKTVTLYNKSGTRYDVNLGDYVFLLQKKVDLLEDVLATQMKNGDVISAKELLDGLLDLYVKEFRQGLYEEDRYIVRNTGVLNNKPIQIDTGRLRANEELKDPKKQAEIILWKTVLLKEWLGENYPELEAHFNARLDNFRKML